MRYFTVVLVCFFAGAVSASVSYAQIAAWNFTGFDGNEENVAATSSDPALITPLLRRGEGLQPATLANSFNSRNYTPDAERDTAIINGDFLEISVEPQPGFSMSLSTIDVVFRRSGTGPDIFQWRYSIDNFTLSAVDIGSPIVYEESGGNGHVQGPIDLSGIDDLQNVVSGTTVTFRLYGWGASATTGTFAFGRRSGNDLEIHGSVQTNPGSDGPIIHHDPLGDTNSGAERTVSAAIIGDGLLTEGNDRPHLWFSVDGAEWNRMYYSDRTDHQFNFTIPGQPAGSIVEYYIVAHDINAAVTMPDGGAPDAPPAGAPPALFSFTVGQFFSDGLGIFLSRDPAGVSEDTHIATSFAGMGNTDGGVQFFGNDDWTYLDPEFSFFIVFDDIAELIAADLALKWDASISDIEISAGNLFGNINHNLFMEQTAANSLHISAASLEGNIQPESGSFLAEITIRVPGPGIYRLSVEDVNLRYYDESEDRQVSIPADAFTGEIRYLLGDFGRQANDGSIAADRGDGTVDFTDLILFADAYWSERNTDLAYRSKYDIGPTSADGSYFTVPEPDGVVDFEDLVIFAIGYYLSAENNLPKRVYEPVTITLGEPMVEGSAVTIPLGMTGGVHEVRAMSIELDVRDTDLIFSDAFAVGEVTGEMGFFASRQTPETVQVDAAIIHASFTCEGILAHLVFEHTGSFDIGSIDFASVTIRDEFNRDLPVRLTRRLGGDPPDVPVHFGIEQNYPNPFNPSTIIDYRLPDDVHVTLTVYTMLGEEVVRLVDDFQERGYHSVIWNGTSMHGRSAPSGMYIYKIEAGGYSEARRMVLIR
jgi:hypothetical protein